jgi:3'5'-cyclic nucleotide phosphodiesterase/Adenylate and Guanylate cyclase catalytic domain
MESTGIPGRIHISQKTADLLVAAGKESWLTKRSGIVEAKGKGSLVTYWLKTSNTAMSVSSGRSDESDNMTKIDVVADIISQLVEWNFGVFKELLQRVVASRTMATKRNSLPSERIFDVDRHGMPLDEISEILETSTFDKQLISHVPSSQDTELGENTEKGLRDFIKTIALLYKANPFHNFEHASHVVMSTMKLLDRIRSHQQEATDTSSTGSKEDMKCLYLDPLTQLGVVFSALIHDADHLGMSNKQIMDDGLSIAKLYGNKSIAEQNSIDVAWKLFMQPNFDALRQCMFLCPDDVKRFRQVVVNSVLATDIFDKDLKSFREERWDQVFTNSSSSSSVTADETNNARKNAIVIEHLIQASDVVHTMQHWKVYQKWNKRLFSEMYVAYQNGHSKESPSVGWYSGELWFFDNYIIPLAKKLRKCGVFGVSCDELLDYAIDNRYEWESKGKEIVVEWEKEFQSHGQIDI